MATRLNTQIPYNSSGIYFQETDLTVVAQTTGGFSAAAVGLMEKGPAFEITNSANFNDRIQRLGDLNEDFPSSFFARQYLEQARNYKEIRILGLEGYSDTKGYAISLQITGANPTSAATFDTTGLIQLTPVVLQPNSLMAVLKERPISLTGRENILSVEVQTATYIDPTTGLSATAATDYLFTLFITYTDASTDSIVCSLRPESKDYIVKKLWSVPFHKGGHGENIYPLVKNLICPLWIDFISPSVKTKVSATSATGYYLPNTSNVLSSLPLQTGNMFFSTLNVFNKTAPGAVITVTQKIVSSQIVGITVTTDTDITSWFTTTPKAIYLTGVTGVGTPNIAGYYQITNPVFATSVTTFDLLDITTGSPVIPSTGTYTTTGAAIQSYVPPTWQDEVLDFTDITYQTPTTPWFVSDADSNGEFKRLFRFWSISDGENANTEIKTEVLNIDPNGNNGSGSFDIKVRSWNDREDLNVVLLETYNNLTLDPTSDNYIESRIGDGEEFSLRSQYIFIEMNKSEQIEPDSLPYGVLGYPNITTKAFNDLGWSLDYDLTKPLSKQVLGLSNNKINTYRTTDASQLKFKNVQNGTVGYGFHLNPSNNSTFATEQQLVFKFANQSIYKDINSAAISPSEKVKRSHYVVAFSGGFDGWNVYKSRTWNNATSRDFNALSIALDKLSDKESLNSDFTVLITPDFQMDNGAASCEAVLDMVKLRGDCVYLPDLAYDVDSDPSTAADIINASNLKSNSSSVYFPWLQIENPIDKNNIWLPPSLLALGTIAYVAQNENVWQPPGGAIRTVTNNLVRSRRRMKQADREILKKANINPITSFPGSGYEITEVRTTQEVFSALSFIHNRLLLCYAKKILNQTLRPLLFQLNGEVSKNAFLTTVTPIFDRIKKLNGVEEYKVEVVDRPELNDRTTLYGRITIVPLYPIEKIVIEFTLVDSGVSFNA